MENFEKKDVEKNDIKEKEKNVGQTENEKKNIFYSIKKFSNKHSVIQYSTIGIALFFLSLMLASQMKSISNTEQVLAGKREDQLADEYITLQNNYNDLKEKYEESQSVVEEYQTSSASNNKLIASMKSQNETLAALAGTTNLKGEGIIITLDDGTAQNSEDKEEVLVHDSDLITIVNELRCAGAEAICINNQRLISTSSIRCVGSVIQVNYQRVAAPFEVKVIGNAQYLESAINIKNGVADQIKSHGVELTVQRNSNIQIPKYDGTLNFTHAKDDN